MGATQINIELAVALLSIIIFLLSQQAGNH